MEDRKPDMKIIDNNPYRLLGVYANSPTRERVANEGKIKAFLKVGKQVPFPLDLRQFLPIPNRTEEMVADAKSRLTLPADQIKYAQFWFLNVTQIDKVAFRHLVEGDMDSAIATWSKAVNTSSLQNRIVCHLMRKDYSSACGLAEKLYAEYASSFVGSVAGDSVNASPSLAYDFLDALCDEIGTSTILKCVGNADWKKHISAEAVSPVIARLQSAVDAAQATRGKGPEARYDAGMKLMNGTKDDLAQLRTLLPTTDLQYQMIADKLGLEILGCGIDYYNDSDEPDAAQKAMTLQGYALTVVVGKMAKDRCQENVDILKKILLQENDEKRVSTYVTQINSLIEQFQEKGHYLISDATKFMEKCVPSLVHIKEELGENSLVYINISTTVGVAALNYLIDKLNTQEEHDTQTLLDAWQAMLNIGALKLDTSFKDNAYKRNRGILRRNIGFGENESLDSLRYALRTSDRFLRYYYKQQYLQKFERLRPTLDLRTEEEIWIACSSYEDYMKYLDRYPNGKHRKEVLAIADKREVEMFKGCKTYADYTAYLKEYPKGRFKEEAGRLADQRFWDNCSRENDYISYITHFPKGKYLEQANRQIDRIKRGRKLMVLGCALLGIGIYILATRSATFRGVLVIVGVLLMCVIVLFHSDNS